jgi:hypothetical protein
MKSMRDSRSWWNVRRGLLVLPLFVSVATIGTAGAFGGECKRPTLVPIDQLEKRSVCRVRLALDLLAIAQVALISVVTWLNRRAVRTAIAGAGLNILIFIWAYLCGIMVLTDTWP